MVGTVRNDSYRVCLMVGRLPQRMVRLEFPSRVPRDSLLRKSDLRFTVPPFIISPHSNHKGQIMKVSSKLLAVLCLVSALALAGLAQTAAPPTPAATPATPSTPTPGPTPLTAAERETALKSLQATRDAFLKSIDGLSEAQWTFKPAPDRWSVAEVAEHITVSEGSIFGIVEKQIMTSPVAPEKRAQVVGKDEIVLQKVPDRSHKAQAPEFLKPTNRFATRAELIKAFEERRKATMDYVRTTNDDLRDHFFAHPLLGELDGYQWILLISAHSERHTKQIEEVKVDPNYPKN
jgi:DinB superfamily